MGSKKYSRVKVVFDTNPIKSGSMTNVLNRKVSALVAEKSGHSHFRVTWCLPEVVKLERHCQMLKEAQKLRSHAGRIEDLLGFQLNITKDLIESIVENNVEKQIREHGIRVLNLDVNRVNWNQLMLDAVYRNPPFADGDNLFVASPTLRSFSTHRFRRLTQIETVAHIRTCAHLWNLWTPEETNAMAGR